MSRLLDHVRRPRHHDAVPLGRTTIFAVFVGAILVLGYSWHQDGVRLPGTSDTFVLKATMRDAAGLQADNEPPVSVSGVPVGRVIDVRYHAGAARVTMRLDGRARGRVFRDAVVRIRPQNGTNVLAVDIRPGTRDAGALTPGSTIDPQRTLTPVSVSEAISTVDADTRAYLGMILVEAGAGLDGRGGDLAKALRSVAKAVDPAAEIAETLSRRRGLVSALVGDIDVIFRTLARRREQLRTMVAASQTVMAASASQDRELAAALRAAPGVIDEVDRTFAVARDVAPRAERAFTAMRPVTKKLEPSMAAVGDLLPGVSRLITATGRLGRQARQPVADLTKVVTELAAFRGELLAIATGVDVASGAIARQKDRYPVVAAITSGLYGQQDDRSALGRTLLEEFEPLKPQNFGLPATPAGARALRRKLPAALEPICGDLVDRCTEFMVDPPAAARAGKAGRP